MTGPVELKNLGASGGYATGPVPPGSSGDVFETQYTLLAENRDDIERINLTFCDFNEKRRIRFFQDGFKVVWKDDVEEEIDLSGYFHPLQAFSGFQKQTFTIRPQSYFYFDPGYYTSTNSYMSLLFAQAYYLPEAEDQEKVLYWSYGSTGAGETNESYAMGNFLCLTGAVSEGATGSAWYSKGFYFTNPTQTPVKLKIITGN